jgi:hypothetical protein
MPPQNRSISFRPGFNKVDVFSPGCSLSLVLNDEQGKVVAFLKEE